MKQEQRMIQKVSVYEPVTGITEVIELRQDVYDLRYIDESIDWWIDYCDGHRNDTDQLVIDEYWFLPANLHEDRPADLRFERWESEMSWPEDPEDEVL